MTLDNRSFYEMAAAVAHQGVDFKKRKNDNAEPETFMLRSDLLESDYQDCLFAFKARGQRLSENPQSRTVAHTLNKFSQVQMLPDDDGLLAIDPSSFARDLALARQKALHLLDQPEVPVIYQDLKFEAKEIVSLLLWVARYALKSLSYPAPCFMSAPLFHEQLTRMAHQKLRRPFLLSGMIGDEKIDMNIDSASLFSANRLKKKSVQNNLGAEPGIRYYHAALRSSFGKELDIVYWLKFDEDHRLLDGQFINLDKPSECHVMRTCFWSPYEHFTEEACRYERMHGTPSSSDLLVRAVLSLYLASLTNLS